MVEKLVVVCFGHSALPYTCRPFCALFAPRKRAISMHCDRGRISVHVQRYLKE